MRNVIILVIVIFLQLNASLGSAQSLGGIPIPDFSPSGAGATNMDLREEMRRFVQSISAYARTINPNFVVIAANAPELLVKRDVSNPERTASAQAYIRAIDGLLMEGLFFPQGKPLEKEKQDVLLQRVREAKKAGLKVLVVDYPKNPDSPKEVDKVLKTSASLGYTPFAAPQPMGMLNAIPALPKRPFAENPKSILSLKDAQNFLILSDSNSFGSQEEFAVKLHEYNFDMVVVDVFHKRKALSKRAVETLKFKKIGGKRLVLAQIDIGSAASYQYYWQSHWREGSPLWITAPHRDNPDKFRVNYWRQEWQQLISGSPTSYLYGVITQGFDGVVLTGVDAYLFFENPNAEDDAQE